MIDLVKWRTYFWEKSAKILLS